VKKVQYRLTKAQEGSIGPLSRVPDCQPWSSHHSYWISYPSSNVKNVLPSGAIARLSTIVLCTRVRLLNPQTPPANCRGATGATMPSIAGGGGWRLFSVGRGVTWLRRGRLHCSPFSSLFGGGGDSPHLPVVIVGAGPVGLVLSFLLTKFGKRLNPPQLLRSNSRFGRPQFGWGKCKLRRCV
jgi:hypothetical protein